MAKTLQVRFKGRSSIRSLHETVSVLTNKGDFDQALRLIHDFVERVFTEPLCVSQVFGSKTLDDLCQRIGKANLVSIKEELGCIEPKQADKPIFVYIVTKLQKSGGHTRVIEDFIKARPEGEHVLLSTELAGRSGPSFLTGGLERRASITFKQAPKLSLQKRLGWLQRQLLEINSERVFLFNHHQDCVAVAAIQPEMKLNASFYHHGDHHLSLGVYLSHLEHIDPHPMGFHHCRDALGIENVYMPLMIEDKGKRPSDQPFMANGTLTTCTVGRANKIEIPYFISYLDVVPELLKTTGGRHVHIGTLSPWARYRVWRGMKRLGIAKERFVYISWESNIWGALHKYKIDLYIASFPYGGGLTLVEAMGAGVPVALHEHIFSRVLAGIDLAYPEVFSWRYPEKLLSYCSSLTPEVLMRHSRLARKQYESCHIPKVSWSEEGSKYTPAALSNEYDVLSDERAAWMTQQVSLHGVISRVVYRILRRLRSYL
ncbi:hypothetical protein [Cycloclasticus zancles]|jgi:hypothetical protein|uniref:Glycosyltransferase n=1 Tax=Cycloclasticus zancles 78-ME TaxID=1198232 RepID=S5T5I0_9GAMM|nr:hypothetical protein [Cycloclasticus zancles]AGS38799.1 hypothetical protein CYCME_0458 [Cycloclasticus zancles 78-ME]